MVRSGSPRRARSDAARNAAALLTAAKELFARYGHDVALDDVARRAGVGNATLYRHFPTRRDLIVAVYADEVRTICEQGVSLLGEEEAGEALFTWLDAFVVHVATKRDLAMVGTDDSDERRGESFDEWHRSMRVTAQRLLVRAQDAGAVRSELGVKDLLALANAVAIAGTDVEHARELLLILRHGL